MEYCCSCITPFTACIRAVYGGVDDDDDYQKDIDETMMTNATAEQVHHFACEASRLGSSLNLEGNQKTDFK